MSNDAALAQLVEVFPDADPPYIASVLAAAGTVEATMERMLGTDYPKRAVERPVARAAPVAVSPVAAARPPKRKNPDEDLLEPTGIVRTPRCALSGDLSDILLVCVCTHLMLLPGSFRSLPRDV